MTIAVYRQRIERPREIARGKIADKGKSRHVGFAQSRIGDCRAFGIHRLQQAADIVRNDISLQRPAGIDIAEYTGQIGDVAIFGEVGSPYMLEGRVAQSGRCRAGRIEDKDRFGDVTTCLIE